MCTFRRATLADLDAIVSIYDAVHTEEEAGRAVIGWDRKIYPTARSAAQAIEAGEMYVEEADGVVGSARINRVQVDVYSLGNWEYECAADGALVLHTLTINPACGGRGLGAAFVAFYEDMARKQGIAELRMDTNAKNLRARALYRKLGYREIGIVPTVFNGIPGVELVLLEKHLEGN
ncbi:MAG: GNAT family N-acetyltransferase [Clostridia bacterium]|nr:GNAT family N-acetyltransferase [Clostridia bacterium]